MSKYKNIPLNINDLNSDHREFINQFNSYFDKSEIFLDLKENDISINLKKLKFDQINEFKKTIENKKTIKDMIRLIEKKINSIGAYGINGNYKNFVDFNKERKVLNRKKKVENRGIHYYSQGNKFSKTNNLFPKKYLNKIITSDSLIFLKKLPDNCIDLVLTSPPYNFGLEYKKNEDDKGWKKYFDNLFEIFKECIRVLKYGGRIIVNVQPLFSDYIPTHHIISNFFIQNKMIWKGEILWEKNNYNCKYTAWGSWKSPSSPYLKYTWEFLEIFCKGDLKKTGESKNIDINDEEFKKWVVAKWSIAPERKMKDFNHPAMFPEELVQRVLKLFSYEKDIILDPFNGAGTTTKVAHDLNRNFIGIDISKKYNDQAKKRIKKDLFSYAKSKSK